MQITYVSTILCVALTRGQGGHRSLHEGELCAGSDPRARILRSPEIQDSMARRKITDGDGLDVSELPDLTPQQMKFVEGIAGGKTASDAYRAAYNTENYSPNAIWVDASRLKSNPKVRLWLAALRSAGFMSSKCTHEEHLRELADLRDDARASGNMGAAILAEVSRGKASGHYTEKVEISAGQSDTAERLRKIAESNPDMAPLAAAIAAKHGITLEPENKTRH